MKAITVQLKGILSLLLVLTTLFTYAQQVNQLSEADRDMLLSMLEEERLAHDVYTTFYEKYDHHVFDNIRSCEKKHVNEIQDLLDYYGVAYTAYEDTEAGQFESKEFQQLYDKLVARGNESMVAALKTGAYIEEMDIMDLKEGMAQTKEEKVREVLQDLERASNNHLRAYARNLDKQEVEYEPQLMPEEDFKAIIEGEHQPCEGCSADGSKAGKGEKSSKGAKCKKAGCCRKS